MNQVTIPTWQFVLYCLLSYGFLFIGIPTYLLLRNAHKRALARLNSPKLEGIECPECFGKPYTWEGECCFLCEGLGRVPEGMLFEHNCEMEKRGDFMNRARRLAR